MCKIRSCPDDIRLQESFSLTLTRLADAAPGVPTFLLADEAGMTALGALLAPMLPCGLMMELDGDLGAGKTTFTRGLLQGLGFHGRVKSPTYTIVESYALEGLAPAQPAALHHFDFYRFSSPEEFHEAGLDEFFGTEAVCLCEWSEKAAPYLPAADIRLALRFADTGRQAEFYPLTEIGRVCLSKLESAR